MEYLNWCADHYWLTFFAMAFTCSGLHGLGRIGSTRIKAEKENE